MQFIKQSTIAVAVLVAICCWTGHCIASITVDGDDGVPGNSWTAGLIVGGVASMDTLELFITSDTGAGPWSNPSGMTAFSNVNRSPF